MILAHGCLWPTLRLCADGRSELDRMIRDITGVPKIGSNACGGENNTVGNMHPTTHCDRHIGKHKRGLMGIDLSLLLTKMDETGNATEHPSDFLRSPYCGKFMRRNNASKRGSARKRSKPG